MQKISELKIEKLVYKGFGLGFDNSVPVFVINAVPEDVVNVRIEYNKGKILFASIDQIVRPSPFRIEPECGVFGLCGGCDWLNIAYEKQLEFKQEIIKEIFRNIPIAEHLPIVGSDQSEFYRNKSYFPISRENGVPVVGMYAKKSRDVVAHKRCRLLPEIFDRIIEVFLKYLKDSHISIYNEKTGAGSARHLGIRYSKTANELIVILVSKTRKIPFSNQLVRVLKENIPNLVGVVQNINSKLTNAILGGDEKILFGRDYIIEELGGKKFKLNYKTFFQVNNSVAEAMYDFVQKNTESSRNILDAFSGAGSIGIFLGEKNKTIFGIENDAAAVGNAMENARINNMVNYEFKTGNAEEELSKICRENDIDTIIFDPPRKGLDDSIINGISNSVNKIIYISCDPSTQQRDVTKLIAQGYGAVAAKPFDMFPQTYHIENVVVMENKS